MASNHRQGVGNLHQQKAGILIAILATVIAALASAAPSADAPDDDVALAVTSITETSTADFAGGSLAGAMVAETDNGAAGGQLRLAAPLGDLFLAATLDSLWHITYPTSGFTPVIEDGVLDVQERNDANYQASGLETWATFENGVVCEVRAMFLPGSAFVNLGFTSTTTSVGQWMFFSTRGTGNQQVPVIKTSLRSAAGSSVDVPTSTTFGEWHVFRIVWVGSTVTYYVDDVMVDQRTNVSITLPQRVAFYKTGGSDSPFFVDWVRVTPYTTSSAAYESRVLDAGTPASPWTALDWAGSTPDTTTVTFETRTGETAVPDTTWSAWSAPAGDDVTSPAGRYLQYRAVMSSTDPAVSPVIDEVSVAYTYPDVTAPTVTGTTPPDGATDVVVGASILAGFDEPIDPATLTAESFTLAPTGGSALPATVSYDSIGDVAILTPAAPLAYATTYEARVTTAVTDLEANPLAADHVWTFTTAAQDTIPLAVVSTVPAAGATNILARRLVTATFSEAVDPATLTATSFTVAPLGGLPVDATVSYDPAGFRAILDSTVDLDWATTYEVRLSTAVTDLSGNPLAQDEVWTFTTRLDAPVTITATTDTDFAAGELGGLAISEVDSSAAAGQLRLDSRLYDSFREPTLDPQWHATNPDGYAPIIENGVLDVQERDGETFDLSSIESYQTWGPGVVLEARAMFVPGSRFIDVGFDGSTINNNQYAWFSTAGTGDQPGNERIYARYREWDHNTIALETTATFNEWHVFKIIWAHGQLQYFVDGVLEAEASNVLITTPMRAAFYKSAYSDTPFYIDWIRVTPYTESIGTYKSPIFDAGEPDANWIDLDWSGSTPAATGIAFTTRSGDTLPPDETWSGWSPVDGGDITSPPGRYVQYRADLTTSDDLVSPVIDEIHLSRDPVPDMTAPAVIATAPADSATGVPLDIVVTATFSEPLDAATVTVETFTLTPEGGEAIVAMVAVDSTSTVATLTPQALLSNATLYEARLTTAIADTAANSLETDHVWTFTTAPLDTVAPAVIATAPADSATGVPVDVVVTATFSEPLDAATVTVETFTLTPEGGEAILATVAMDSTSTVATLTPQAQLSSATLYEARLTTAIADTAANSLVADHVWAFTTATLDTVAPAVIATAPADSATGVPLDAVVTATFSEPLDAATVTVETFTLTPEGGEAIVAMVAVDSTSTVATLTPQAQLSSATLYEARLTTVIADTAGNPLVTEVVWSFTTRLIDAAAPTVTATIPVASAVGIPVGVVVTATFSEPLDAATVTVETFTLTPEGGEAIVATVAVDSTSTVATLTPQAPLQEGTEYEARLTTTVADTAGNPLASDHVWTFTTVYPVGVPAEVLPAATALLPNAPNPFNPTTTVSFDLARDQQVAVRIYAVDGRLVRTLAAGHLAAGRYTELWNGTDDGGRSVATGVYLLRLESADLVQTRKMSLVK